MIDTAFHHSWLFVLVWGLIATAIMSTVTEGAQMLGISRMSLPFLFGTMFASSRHRAQVIGYILYSLGGLVFGLVYVGVFYTLDYSSWWFGALMGFLHGLFLITVMLPTLPYVHPRMATDYDGPTSRRRVEPPGPFGLHYGRLTPTITVLAQALFGLVLGIAYAH
ncbi:hypothetical protein [Pararhizobium mangrovi]|uniref:Uncharacterized protein n=1 Tax=Pararhizobium mangrovi TaxID=2590452 RepID=A0A506U4Z7_9HYPH|nr:hypothetical protein [Pararhizobium mangrovi]TPW26987.1 hypothetical protein FJU11_12635 [Pararhizobium mangrovi]